MAAQKGRWPRLTNLPLHEAVSVESTWDELSY